MKNGIGLLILIATLVLSISGRKALPKPKINDKVLSPEKQHYVVEKFKTFNKCNSDKNNTQISNKIAMAVAGKVYYKPCEDQSDMCLFRCVLKATNLMIDGDLETSTLFPSYFNEIFNVGDVPRQTELKKHYLACHKEKAGTNPSDTTCASTEKFFDCFVEKFNMVCDVNWKKE